MARRAAARRSGTAERPDAPAQLLRCNTNVRRLLTPQLLPVKRAVRRRASPSSVVVDPCCGAEDHVVSAAVQRGENSRGDCLGEAYFGRMSRDPRKQPGTSGRRGRRCSDRVSAHVRACVIVATDAQDSGPPAPPPRPSRLEHPRREHA